MNCLNLINILVLDYNLYFTELRVSKHCSIGKHFENDLIDNRIYFPDWRLSKTNDQ